ncbi:restriction endonuclease subunit S, partial [bacterium]|nr:restriction endonuclease subunit S [bacterium]
QTTIGEFCPFKYGKGLSAKDRLSGNFPVYGSNGVVGFHNEVYVKTHGIVIGRKGSVGALHLSDGPFWPIDTSFYVVKEDYFETVYTYYLLRSLGLDRMNSDSAVPGLNRDNVHALKINIFDMKEERSAIGKLISKFDDKIENNRRMNETLEEMAQAIFKSWFVDFDPVHAKAAGNAPAHMDANTAALFPSSFGDDGLPVGWKYKKLEDISDLSWGDLNTTKKSYVETGFDAYSASGKDGKLPHFDFEKLGVVLSAIGANCGRTWLARGKWSCIKNTIRFWSKCKSTPTIFLFHTTRGNNFWPIRGSAQPFISQGDARSQKAIVPANGEAVSFGGIVGGYFEKISTNEDENKTLAELRDTLLPKLMSGEIRVADAEREVKAVV